MSDTALAVQSNNAVSVLTPSGFEAAMNLAKTLVDSGFLPKAVDKPAKALAIIIAGQEIGMPPMKSLRSFHIIEGKPSLSSNAMLERFTERGGDVQWIVSDEKTATIKLTPRGKTAHVETFTIADAQKAGLTGKDNWKKYTKAMLRARAGSAGLRAIGESEGMYDPDELGAMVTPDGDVYEPPTKPFNVHALPGLPKNYAEVVNEETGEVTAVKKSKKRSSLLASVHILKQKLNIPDAVWVARLNQRFKVDSSAKLSDEQLAELAKALEATALKEAEARAGAAEMAEQMINDAPAARTITDLQTQLITEGCVVAGVEIPEACEWHEKKYLADLNESEAADIIDRLSKMIPQSQKG